MSDEHSSAHAKHDDDRIQALRRKYGENANLTVDELRKRASEQGIAAPSQLTKEELLEAIGPEHRH